MSATRLSSVAFAAAILVVQSVPALAGYVVDLTEQAGNVVATGSGAIDLAGLLFQTSGDAFASMVPDFGSLAMGPALPTTPPGR
jgi:hypothetical protein